MNSSTDKRQQAIDKAILSINAGIGIEGAIHGLVKEIEGNRRTDDEVRAIIGLIFCDLCESTGHVAPPDNNPDTGAPEHLICPVCQGAGLTEDFQDDHLQAYDKIVGVLCQGDNSEAN